MRARRQPAGEIRSLFELPSEPSPTQDRPESSRDPLPVAGGDTAGQPVLPVQATTILRQWTLFLDSGFAWERFTKGVYDALTLWCCFIAHYNRWGFYDVYFGDEAEATLAFIDQFVSGRSAEMGDRGWAERSGSDVRAVLPRAMCAAMRPRAAQLRAMALERQRARDLRVVDQLAARHGLLVSGGGHVVRASE